MQRSPILNSLKGGYIGDTIGKHCNSHKGDTGRLDYSSNAIDKEPGKGAARPRDNAIHLARRPYNFDTDCGLPL